jgi:hypothetical protein
VAGNASTHERHNEETDAAQARKTRIRLNTLIILLAPVLGIVLPQHYKGIRPFLFLIPLVLFLINKFREADAKSRNASPNQNHPMLEGHLYMPKDPKDPRRYKPIG